MNAISWILTFISFFSLCGELSAQAKKLAVSKTALQKVVLTGPAQGTSYHITYFHPQQKVSKSDIDSLVSLIDASMSNYHPQSSLSQFNRISVSKIKLDEHFKKVIAASFHYHRLTDGIFDITVAPLVQLWGFGPQKIKHFPDSSTIEEAMKSVGMQHLKWKSSDLIKLKPGLSIDVNGIAQGYTVDFIADYLKKKGIRHFIAELGGEMRISGRNATGEAFKIGIERPLRVDGKKLKTVVIQVPTGALTTAGNFEKYLMQGHQKISHHINPLTGYMFASNMISVTVFAKTAMEADALDNYFMALSPQEILSFVKKHKNLEVYMIFKNKTGEIEEQYSEGFSSFFST